LESHASETQVSYYIITWCHNPEKYDKWLMTIVNDSDTEPKMSLVGK